MNTGNVCRFMRVCIFACMSVCARASETCVIYVMCRFSQMLVHNEAVALFVVNQRLFPFLSLCEELH